MMTTKLRKSFFLFLTLFLASFVVAQSASAAAKLNLSPASSTVNKDSQFDINLTIDVEQNQSVGSDAVITYPVADLDLVIANNGGFFTNFSWPADTTNGRIEIHGFFSAAYQSKSGSGTFAKITFKAKKDSGSGSLAFICTGSGNDTQILNSDGQNILTCSNTTGSSLSYSASSGGGGGGSNPTPTPTPSAGGGATPKPTPTPTKKPTPKPTLKASPSPDVSPTPQVIELVSNSPTPEPQPSLFPEEEQKPNNNLLLIGGGGGILVLIIIGIILFKKLSEGEEPPSQGPISPQPPTTLGQPPEVNEFPVGQQIPPVPPYEPPPLPSPNIPPQPPQETPPQYQG